MKNAHRQKIVGLAVVLLAGWMLVTTGTGCGPATEPPPKVFPVKGVVKFMGGAPLENGVIEFRLEANPTFAMTSAISPEGEFELHTLFGSQKLPGGAAGACRVTVYAITKTGELVPHELVLPRQPITIEEKANEFAIEIE